MQNLRLVVPQNTPRDQVLRTVLPMQIDVDGAGEYDVWLRLVRERGDKTTPWQRVAAVNITTS